MKRVSNPEEKWVGKDGAFERIVEPNIFYEARGIINARSRRFSNDELLSKLKDLRDRKGYLSAMFIDEAQDMPSSSVYSGRFGGLIRAYKLVGFYPERDYSFIEINKFLRNLHGDVFNSTMEGIIAIGGNVSVNAHNDLLTVNDWFTCSVVICRNNQLNNGRQRRKFRFDTTLCPDITIAVRMNKDNKNR